MIGIVLGLALLVFLAYKGYSIIWVAPVSAMVVALTGGLSLLPAYTDTYMQGLVDFAKSWFPMFLLGAIFGKAMEVTGAAHSVAKKLSSMIGAQRANPGGDYQLRYFGLWRNFTVCGCVCHLSDCRILIPGG